MRLTRESGQKKKKQPAIKDGKKHHDHVAAYMREEMHQAQALTDLFEKRK